MGFYSIFFTAVLPAPRTVLETNRLLMNSCQRNEWLCSKKAFVSRLFITQNAFCFKVTLEVMVISFLVSPLNFPPCNAPRESWAGMFLWEIHSSIRNREPGPHLSCLHNYILLTPPTNPYPGNFFSPKVSVAGKRCQEFLTAMPGALCVGPQQATVEGKEGAASRQCSVPGWGAVGSGTLMV